MLGVAVVALASVRGAREPGAGAAEAPSSTSRRKGAQVLAAVAEEEGASLEGWIRTCWSLVVVVAGGQVEEGSETSRMVMMGGL